MPQGASGIANHHEAEKRIVGNGYPPVVSNRPVVRETMLGQCVVRCHTAVKSLLAWRTVMATLVRATTVAFKAEVVCEGGQIVAANKLSFPFDFI